MNKNTATVVKNGKILRMGYTTGSCASAAAAASTLMLLSGERQDGVQILLANGEKVYFSVEDSFISSDRAGCCVIKDAGDDPDVTGGMKICVVCEKLYDTDNIIITGGEGVGLVTSDGLACPKGEYAINPVPRKMIGKNVKQICLDAGWDKGIKVTVSVPGGEQTAKKTFNPRLGIIGGISILGTTGIVEPMSNKAVIETIKIEIDRYYYMDNQNILVAPGNYGKDFCREKLGLDTSQAVKCSNFIGETIDYIAFKGFKRVLLTGHAGKLVKLAGAVMNTHSSYADCRMEILGVHAAMAGANVQTVASIMDCLTVDAAIDILETAGFKECVFESIMKKILFHLDYRVKGAVEFGVAVFSTGNVPIVQSSDFEDMAKLFTKK